MTDKGIFRNKKENPDSICSHAYIDFLPACMGTFFKFGIIVPFSSAVKQALGVLLVMMGTTEDTHRNQPSKHLQVFVRMLISVAAASCGATNTL